MNGHGNKIIKVKGYAHVPGRVGSDLFFTTYS